MFTVNFIVLLVMYRFKAINKTECALFICLTSFGNCIDFVALLTAYTDNLFLCFVFTNYYTPDPYNINKY